MTLSTDQPGADSSKPGDPNFRPPLPMTAYRGAVPPPVPPRPRRPNTLPASNAAHHAASSTGQWRGQSTQSPRGQSGAPSNSACHTPRPPSHTGKAWPGTPHCLRVAPKPVARPGDQSAWGPRTLVSRRPTKTHPPRCRSSVPSRHNDLRPVGHHLKQARVQSLTLPPSRLRELVGLLLSHLRRRNGRASDQQQQAKPRHRRAQ